MPRKTINVFGCSQSYGIPEYTLPDNLGFGNWVYWLSVWNPNIIFNNYSMQGTSLTYSCHLYDEFHNQADLNIIQMTGPHRMTYYTPLLDPFEVPLLPITSNYKKIDIDWFRRNFITYTHHVENMSKNLDQNADFHPTWAEFAKEYYEVKPREHGLIEHISLMHRYGTKADLAFSHAKFLKFHYTELHEIVPSIILDLTNEEYENYKCDTLGHFGEEGHKYMARWVAKRLNLAFSE